MRDPLIGVFFSAGRTEPGLTSMRDLFGDLADQTDKQMEAEESGAAGEHFEDIGDNGRSQMVAMF